jgi:transcription initiation factor IIE alpha subunit
LYTKTAKSHVKHKTGGEKEMKTKLLLEYNVDLAKINGSGDFPCPKCGANMSPEDQTEETYSIKEIKTRQDSLEELVIQCHRCKSLIRLTGFKPLDSLEGDA